MHYDPNVTGDAYSHWLQLFDLSPLFAFLIGTFALVSLSAPQSKHFEGKNKMSNILAFSPKCGTKLLVHCCLVVFRVLRQRLSGGGLTTKLQAFKHDLNI